MQSKLPTDRLAFPIVANADDLLQAKTEGHPNVRVTCKCGKSFVTSTGNAHNIIVVRECICAPDYLTQNTPMLDPLLEQVFTNHKINLR